MSSLRLLPLLTSVFAVASVRGVGLPPASPEAMAAEVRALVSSGAGVLMPDLDRAYIADGGLVPLGEGDFPAMFLHGLVAEWRDGVAVFPVEVRLDDATGDAYFLDALGEPFWYIPSEVPERYRPWLVANPWFAPSRAGIRWTFVHDADVALLRAASAPAGRRDAPLRSAPPPPVTNLCFTGFSYTGTSVWFSAAWPASALPLPGDTLDVYAKTNLLDAHWFPLAELPVAPAATNATLEIAGEDIPGFFVPPHVHDASCPAVTNITFDLVSNEPVTGIVYRCYRYQAVSSGFLRLGTRLDTDGDGLSDAAELLVHETRPDRLDTDGDGVPDGIVPSVWWNNSIWATNDLDIDFIVDIVAPSDGSAETVLTLDGWRIPLSPLAGPWCFSLPPGQIVNCSVSTSGPFFILWAGTPGGSLWDIPESFHAPFWTRGIRNVTGHHETPGSCDIAVPVLTVTPILPAPSIPATSPSGSHVSSDGSVCVHASDGIQRFAWTIAPSIAGSGRTPSVTGAVQLDSEGPYIDVSDATDVRTGTLSFAENDGGNGIGTIWGMLTSSLSAHRCDATLTSPYCSICGCYEPLDLSLHVSKTVLTLKHDNQATISIIHPHSPNETFSEKSIEIRKVGDADWLPLGMEANLQPWTARIAGFFELRGAAVVNGSSVYTPSVEIEVRFPSVEQIAADESVIDMADTAWFFTKTSCTRVPNERSEWGSAVRLNTTNNEYVCDYPYQGPTVNPWTPAIISLDLNPYDDPEEPKANDPGAVYLVAGFHTHPPTVYLEGWINLQIVGPSEEDHSAALHQQIPGIVYDYAPADHFDNAIPPGHPIDAPAQFYFTSPPLRRPTPQRPTFP